MSRVSRIGVFALALVLAAIAAPGAQAQDSTVSGSGGPSFSHIVGPNIRINPRPLYRRCSSWYVVQYRPSGQVLFPEKHCWWVRG